MSAPASTTPTNVDLPASGEDVSQATPEAVNGNQEVIEATPSVTETTENEENVPSEQELASLTETDNNLIDIINSMEADRKKFLTHVRTKISSKEAEFDKANSENARLQARINEMEICLRQNNIDFVSAASTPKPPKKGKANNEGTADILTQAKTLLFEKTKICKQQEQQLAALKTQVEATKDVLAVTKEMLCLRNIENDHTQARLDTLDLKLKNERARLELSEKKLAVSQKMYTDLRAEYELQSSIFKQLRAGYEGKIAILTKQVETYKSK